MGDRARIEIHSAEVVLPVSGPPIRGGTVAHDGSTILDVGPADEMRAKYPRSVSYIHAGCLLMPGLVNAHTHLEFSFVKSMIPASRGFLDWLFRVAILGRRSGEKKRYKGRNN